MAQVHPIDSAHEAEELAVHLCSAERRHPAVVVTTSGRGVPLIDVEQVSEEVGDLAEVYLVSHASFARVLTALMPDGAGLVAGAGRAYPAGSAWLDHPSVFPVRRAYEAGEGARSTRSLVSDALALASDTGEPGPDRATREWATARVVRIAMPERAWLLIGRAWAHVAQELTVPGVDLHRVLAPEMAVSGWLDPATGRLDVRPSFSDAATALGRYAPGDVVLARVRGVRAERAELLLHPGVAVTVHRDEVTGNDLDDLRGLMSSGEVLAARVLTAGPRWALSLLDVDDTDEAVPAPALLPGGPPWLVPEVDAASAVATSNAPAPVADEPPPLPPPPPAVPAAATVPARPRPSPAMLDRRRRAAPRRPAPAPPTPSAPAPAPPRQVHRPRPGPPRKAVAPPAPASAAPPAAAAATGPAPGSAAASMARTVDGLKAEVTRVRAALAEAEDQARSALAEVEDLVEDRRVAQVEIHRLGQEVRTLRASVRKARQAGQTRGAAPAAAAPRPEFADAEAGFRHAVLTDWATRIPVGEQEDCPLVDYDLGPRFLDSLSSLEGVSAEKVAAVVVDVVTGRAAALAGRSLHQLRVSESGGSAGVRREDGATCWRASLQNATPQARRLHYWVLPGGRVELSRVVVHDDTDP